MVLRLALIFLSIAIRGTVKIKSILTEYGPSIKNVFRNPMIIASGRRRKGGRWLSVGCSRRCWGAVEEGGGGGGERKTPKKRDVCQPQLATLTATVTIATVGRGVDPLRSTTRRRTQRPKNKRHPPGGSAAIVFAVKSSRADRRDRVHESHRMVFTYFSFGTPRTAFGRERFSVVFFPAIA